MIRPLSIVWNFDPVFFSIGSLDIRYYGLMWALAILIGAKFFDNFCKREGLPPKVSESIFIYGTLATIIGARLGHCLFYDPMEYLSKPWTIITGFRDGGMASHGAAIGLLIGLWLFSRKNKLPYIWSLDRIMIAVGIGGAVVRLGNLFNSEIFGMATTLPWGFEFVRSAKWVNEFAPAAVHPTQIYEALCYLITFGILCWLYYAKDIARRRPGILFGIGLLGIFLTRFFIEFIKTEQEAFEQGWVLDMGQWLSIPFIVLGIYMIYRGAVRARSFPRSGAESPGSDSKKEETMSNYPMVDEVNRLVGNLLAAGSGVFLPGVGSLFVERRGARRLSKRTVLPPCRVVSFSSQQQGVSLADELARTLHCDAAGAQDVYDRWLSRTREGDVLTIEGVGVLKFKNFTLAPAFDRLLNPQGHEPVRIKPARRLDWALWVGIAAIVIAAGFGGAEFLRINSSDIPEPGAAAEVARTLPAADAGIPADSSATAGVTDDGTATAVAGTKAAETDVAGSSAAGAAGTADSAGDRTDAAVTRADARPAGQRPGPAARVSAEPASLVSGHRYVVLGVFSTPENAARAAADAEARDASVRCGVYRFGNKFMVSPFEAPDAEACTLFIRNYSDRFPGLWTYTAR